MPLYNTRVIVLMPFLLNLNKCRTPFPLLFWTRFTYGTENSLQLTFNKFNIWETDTLATFHNVYLILVCFGLGVKKFISETLTNNTDTYFVTMEQAIAWMKEPTTLEKIKEFEPWSC